MTKDNNYACRTALIIGGCRGIGRAIAIRLAKDGFDIIATARNSGTHSENLNNEICACGRKFTLLTFDVRDRDATAAAFAPLTENPPDVVVYNSGIAKDNLFVFMTPEEWDDVMDTNIDGFYHTVQPLIFGMMARKSGRIIIISSASGQTGQAGQVNYSASKAALIGAAKALAREIGKKGILVNVVAPGFIATEMTEHIPTDKVLPLIPLNRAGAPEEVAGAVSFLCGPDSSYIHGQVIPVNGGLVI
ncbi:MAG: 3-oxoacyl-ACP reductase FabG [Victivallaceae bacterium]|nr:3-oxoacyl-ACP reductase FabG [Victivallaceae bacterium]NLK82490.1 3-oxoacyl-ACP reductase FabG [Lentisphaerota bacterium]MDD3116986.1 3-oxoacyl-ACP reductase FabG [Victivallaceae bacterium]MDD3703696.1 3-oxoacyl-ACP reductase FabG [Victivallaceae bacterium]MDD4318193.1 3-oxoacyl-ACP reductase FabG [Victivallaceae bacterium]